jgi:extradiol dioxygenase family protein
MPEVSRAANPPMNADSDKSTTPRFTTAAPLAGVHDQVTFLYYSDLEPARRFYGELLGLSPYYDTPWVTLYRSSPGATIGIVKRPQEQISADAKRDAVMVSIVTDDVQSWYQRLKRGGQIRFEKDIYDHPAVPIRAFLIRDPAGYSVEFFEWRKH